MSDETNNVCDANTLNAFARLLVRDAMRRALRNEADESDVSQHVAYTLDRLHNAIIDAEVQYALR